MNHIILDLLILMIEENFGMKVLCTKDRSYKFDGLVRKVECFKVSGEVYSYKYDGASNDTIINDDIKIQNKYNRYGYPVFTNIRYGKSLIRIARLYDVHDRIDVITVTGNDFKYKIFNISFTHDKLRSFEITGIGENDISAFIRYTNNKMDTIMIKENDTDKVLNVVDSEIGINIIYQDETIIKFIDVSKVSKSNLKWYFYRRLLNKKYDNLKKKNARV